MIGVLVGMAAVGLSGSAADEPPDESQAVGGLDFLDAVEVPIVNGEVFVGDGDGRPVTDPGVDDCRVHRDGEEREITDFLLVEPGRHRIGVVLLDRLTRQTSYQVHSVSTPDAS
jgi:hypothetical protein